MTTPRGERVGPERPRVAPGGPWGWRVLSERGSSTATVVVLIPVFLVLLMFIVYVGRLVGAHQDVLSASRDAARSASVRSLSSAQGAGQRAALTTLEDRQVTCGGGLEVVVDIDSMEPGGVVTSTVTCVVLGSDLLPFWAPGAKRLVGTSVAPVDRYREK